MKVLHRVRVALALIGIGILTAGCQDVTQIPVRFAGTYVLQSINGHSLPAVAAEGGGQRFVVLADSLFFDPAGTVRRSYIVRWTSTTVPIVDTTYHRTMTLPYSIEGKRVVIGAQSHCPANANCTGWNEGTIDFETARISERRLWLGEPEFVYHRR